MNKPTIAITMGDPAGIGPEIVARVLGEPEVRACCNPVVIGDPKILARAVELGGEQAFHCHRANGCRCGG